MEIVIKLLFAGIIQLVLKKKRNINHVLLVPSEWKELNFLNVALGLSWKKANHFSTKKVPFFSFNSTGILCQMISVSFNTFSPTAFDPCTSGNYQTLSSSDRLVSNTNQSSLKCDRYTLIPGWYRFTGDAGDGMPSYCPPIRRCGTHATGWLNGSYPTLAEGAVTRKVCYHWSNKCCRWSNNIKIKNCNGYYVYQLAKPPTCHLRYCGNGQPRKC